MNDDAPPPPVTHHIRCICARCMDERRAEAEARRRIEEARREERRGREMAFLEAMSGPLYSRLGMPQKPQPGTVRAINARYGKKAS